MKQVLELQLNQLLKTQFNFSGEVFLVTTLAQFGDYTSTVAWQLAQHEHNQVWDYAQELALHLSSNAYVRIEAQPPGYLNFSYQPKLWVQEIRYLLKQKLVISSEQIADPLIRYAYQRNALVLKHLSLPKRFDWPKPRWADPAHPCMLELVKFRDYFNDRSASKNRSDGVNYLKNLARTIHYLYNDVTLVTKDAQRDKAVAAILQASQHAIAQGLNLAGGKVDEKE